MDSFKKITTLLSLALLTACASTPRAFDSLEYNYVVSTTVNATRAIHVCTGGSEDALVGYIQEINSESMKLEEYTANKKDSTLLNSNVKELRKQVNELLIRGNYTPAYCIHKLGNIQTSARIISRELGGNVKYSTCTGDVKKRFDAFTLSYAKGKLSDSEYKELASDIIKLESIDSKTCSLEELRELRELIANIKQVIGVVSTL